MTNLRIKTRWFSPVSDLGFKKLFAQEGNEDLLITLLNSILDEEHVVGVKLLNTTHPINLRTYSVFDIYCTLENGSHIIVEMQKVISTSKPFQKRAKAYIAMGILDQAKENWEYDYSPVYFIGILNDRMFQDNTPIRRFKLIGDDPNRTVLDDQTLEIFVELPKLAKDINPSASWKEKFLVAIRDMASWEKKPDWADEEELDLLLQKGSFNLLGNDELAYLQEMTTKEDYDCALADHIAEFKKQLEAAKEAAKEEVAKAAKEAAEKATKEVEEKAAKEAAEKSLVIAKKLLAMGMSLENVSDVTGLSIEELKSIE